MTSPHVHAVFAQLSPRRSAACSTRIGVASDVELVEVGAGDGTLMRAMLPELGDLALRVTAVERSPGARAALATIDGDRGS